MPCCSCFQIVCLCLHEWYPALCAELLWCVGAATCLWWCWLERHAGLHARVWPGYRCVVGDPCFQHFRDSPIFVIFHFFVCIFHVNTWFQFEHACRRERRKWCMLQSAQMTVDEIKACPEKKSFTSTTVKTMCLLYICCYFFGLARQQSWTIAKRCTITTAIFLMAICRSYWTNWELHTLCSQEILSVLIDP